uniref:Uncharacterized protein n=1 Tax=Anguilla anguilla TaxID=7936 RepID=A0A0E9Q7X7_ANGAN
MNVYIILGHALFSKLGTEPPRLVTSE